MSTIPRPTSRNLPPLAPEGAEAKATAGREVPSISPVPQTIDPFAPPTELILRQQLAAGQQPSMTHAITLDPDMALHPHWPPGESSAGFDDVRTRRESEKSSSVIFLGYICAHFKDVGRVRERVYHSLLDLLVESQPADLSGEAAELKR